MLNEIEGFVSFERTEIYRDFLHSPEKVIGVFSGNQFGKTSMIAHSYIVRLFGLHPVESKNMRPHKKIRTYRFCSTTLPTDPTSAEVKNTIYPAIKKFLPRSLIKKDITVRRPVITVKDPQGGDDVNFEFVSYSQDLGTQAGVQRESIWLDEDSGLAFYEEQLPRLVAANGDLVYSLTPVEGMGFQFDAIFERARRVVRSQTVIDRIKKRTGKLHKQEEFTDSLEDIVVIQGATDDNPTLKQEAIDNLYSKYDDEDVIDIRRYGIFRQVSGTIFKDFSMKTHKISGLELWDNGLPPQETREGKWVHARMIDYHQRNPWAIVWVAISPMDEAFVYCERNPSPERMVTLEISKMINDATEHLNYPLNLIDPLAGVKQGNTGVSVMDDLNRHFREFRNEGIGTGGFWKPWDTKSTRGRDEIRKRLKNSMVCGKPFNNFGRQGERLPTLWILETCKETLLSLKNWRMEEWANRNQLVTKEEKEVPQQKWSHFPMCLEAIFKEGSFRACAYRGISERRSYNPNRMALQ